MVSSSSNSTSRSITIILLSLVVEALLKYQYHFLYQPLFLSFSCFLLFYISIPHHCFIRDHNRNKVTQLFRVILPSHVMPNFSTTIFNFNEFIFVYVVNIRFICDGKLYKIYLSYKSCTCAINTMNTLTVQAFTLTQHEIIKTIHVSFTQNHCNQTEACWKLWGHPIIALLQNDQTLLPLVCTYSILVTFLPTNQTMKALY